MTSYASDRESLRSSTRDRYARQLDYLKSALSAQLVENDGACGELEAVLDEGELLSPIDELVKITATSQSRVFRGLLKVIGSMTAECRDPMAVIKMLEQQIAHHLATYAIQLADQGVPRYAHEREKTFQTMGAYGRALQLMQEAGKRFR